MESDKPAEERSEEISDIELNEQEAIIVKFMLEGAAVQEVADAIGRSARHVYIVRHRPHVAAAIRDGMQAGLARAQAALTRNSIKAAQALIGMAEDAEDPNPARVAAAKAVIETAIKIGEFSGEAAPKKSEVDVKSGLRVLAVLPDNCRGPGDSDPEDGEPSS